MRLQLQRPRISAIVSPSSFSLSLSTIIIQHQILSRGSTTSPSPYFNFNRTGLNSAILG
ncbi:unnamed protein product [Rhodiola kirilowii]